MRSYKEYRACFRTRAAGCGNDNEKDSLERGFNVLLSGTNQEPVKNQKQRREILRAASNKLRNEVSSGKKTKGHTNWLKASEVNIKDNDEPQPHVPKFVAEIEEAIISNEVIESSSPTPTEISDYTTSSTSMDDQASDHKLEGHCISFNGRLGQWDLVDDACCSTALLPVGNKEDEIRKRDNLCHRDLALETTCGNPPHYWPPSPVHNYTKSTSSQKSKDCTALQLSCPSRDEIHYDAREHFDIVYDVFYQDEGFEPYEGFVVTEDLQNAVKEGFEMQKNPLEGRNSRSSTPLLERADSPEFSARTTVKSLPSMSAHKSSENEFLSFSSQGLMHLPVTYACNSGQEEQPLSFSRRDFTVLRQSLRELQVGMLHEHHNGFQVSNEEIQEDLSPTLGVMKEENRTFLGGHEQKKRTSHVVNCQEMLTQQETKVRPLSAARVLRPLSSSVMPRSQLTRPDDLREHCFQIRSSTEMTPKLLLQGAQLSENWIGECMLQWGRKPTMGFPETDAVDVIDLASSASSLASSYATPRTGISADELESSVSTKNVPSRSELHEATEGSVLELLSAKVQLLDVTQQKYLLEVLSKIERAKISGNLDLPSMFASLERPLMGVPLTSPEVEGAPKAHLIVLRILSTWGDTKCVGLVEIDIFDIEGSKVELHKSDISLVGTASLDTTSNEILSRIINGIVNTTRERHMWCCPLPPPGKPPLEIHIKVPFSDLSLGHMKVWNYNQSISDIIKGVKEVQAYVDGELIWQGVISKGCGNQVFDYSSRIPLLDDTPNSETASTTQIHGSCILQENHFVASNLESDCRVHGREVPDCAPTSVGTSFTFSPIGGSSSPSICGTSSCASGEQNLLTSPSILDGENNNGTLDKNFTAGAKKLSKARSRLSSPCESAQCATNDGRRAEAIGDNCSDRVSLPIWLKGSSKMKPVALELGNQQILDEPKAGDHSLESDMQQCIPLQRLLREEFPDCMLPAGRQNPTVKGRSTCRSFGSMSGSMEKRDQESEACFEMGFPRKQRLLHSAFSGLKKVVVRLKLGLKLAGREEIPLTEGSTHDSATNKSSLLSTCSLARSKFLLGLGCKKPPLFSQPEVEIEGDKEDLEEAIEHFETPGVAELRNELHESWDSLVQFQSAQMADSQFYSSVMSCQQMYNSATQSTQFFSVGSSGSESPPSPSNTQLTEMIIQTRMELESLRCGLGDAVNAYSDSKNFRSAYSWDISTEFRPDFELSGHNEDRFTVPILPTGQELIVNIISTWGDPHYVGLVGIELFDGNGNLIELLDPFEQVQADPPDINILPGYKNDPRTVDKLVDNVNMTCDDYHVWLTPFTAGQSHLIRITMNSPTSLSMVRFWNYNKSRIHSFRGARVVEITFDQKLIFVGELGKASGSLIDAAQRAEPILFTTDEAVLVAIQHYDQRYHKETESVLAYESAVLPLERPDTHGRYMADATANMAVEYPSAVALGGGGRPLTHAIRLRSIVKDPIVPVFCPDAVERYTEKDITEHTRRHQEQCPVGQILKLKLIATWGDPHYVGLTAVEVLDLDGAPYPITEDALSAKPRDLNDIPGCKGDHRTLKKIVDGCCTTTNDHHMWLIPFDGDQSEHWLRIDLGKPVPIAALRIWNYNKSLEDTGRGVKWLQVFVDELEVSPPGGGLVRKAPGTDIFDFGHLLPLSRSIQNKLYTSQLELCKFRDKAKQRRSHNEFLCQEYETPLLPCGYMIKLVLLSTWGDQHYMGLNGIELYDEAGRLLPMDVRLDYKTSDGDNVHASPSSINDLAGVADIRTLDKLIDGDNNTWDDQHMWLTVYNPGKSNKIYIIFEQPVMLSVVRIWNYSKTPTRGVYDVEIYVDDLLVYKGFLKQAPSLCSVTSSVIDFSQSIVFTNDEGLLQTHMPHLYFRGDIEHTDVVLINEKNIESAAKPSNCNVYETQQRPPTGLSGLRRL